MTAIEMKKQAKTRDERERTLRIRNIYHTPSIEDMFELFTRELYHVCDIRIQSICPEDGWLTEAFVSMPAREAIPAREWLNGKRWRSRKLDVQIRDADRWSS
jgi:hypothetical protein